jgi:hypothetical protein
VPQHLRWVVQPVTADAMAAHGAHGPRLQVAMFELDEPPPADEVEVAADRLRAWYAARDG